MYVTVRENNVDQALRVLKKKLQREGVFREMKNRRAYEKPSERRAREAAESTRRVRKLMRKRMAQQVATQTPGMQRNPMLSGLRTSGEAQTRL